MHVALLAPFSSDDIPGFFSSSCGELPVGYRGAPFVSSIALELISRGVEVTIFTTDSYAVKSPQVYEKNGLRVVFCPSRRRAWGFNGFRFGRIVDFFAFERDVLGSELKKYSPDLVHAHWAYEFAMVAIASGIPAVVSLHDSPRDVFFHTKSLYRLFRWVMSSWVMAQDMIFTSPSPYLYDRLNLRVHGGARVIPNPVSDLAFSLGRVRVSPEARRIAVVCNGWSGLKNPEAAIRAFGLFRAICGHAELHLFGSGFEVDGVGHNWAASNSLDQGCFFHGALDNRKLMLALTEFDVLMHTSREESFGVVIAEAMALGLPIVAGERSGAVPWVMGASIDADGKGSKNLAGVLVNVEDPVSILNGLLDVFGSEYGKFSCFGYNRSREFFSRSTVVDEYLNSYALALS